MVANDWSLLCREWKRSTCIRSHNTGPQWWTGLSFLQSFILLLHLWGMMVQRAVHRAKRVVKEIKCLFHLNGFGSAGRDIMWLNWDMSILGCRKGNHVCSVVLHSYLWLQHFNCLSPSGLSLVWCCAAVFQDNCFLAVFTICDCFVAEAVWEPPLIVDVLLQHHRHLHDFPPVVDLKVFRTFCKTCL